MEVLAQAGLRAVLFLDIPRAETLARFPDVQAVGIVGTARSQTVAQIEQSLPPVFAALAKMSALVTHYKICSTLDSSPEIGSIGRAAELALAEFPNAIMPFLVPAPMIKRWQCFGTLFAAAPGGVFRLDRHPVMARHPVTPMDEADVIAHLSRQTDLPMGLLSVVELEGDAATAFAQKVEAGQRLVAMDCVTDGHLECVGSLIWAHRGPQLFAIGSQGVEYALVAHWRKVGLLDAPVASNGVGTARLAVVSGSVSPTTAEQIAWAEANGFACIALDAAAVVKGGSKARASMKSTLDAALGAFSQGADPLIFTARGPDDPAVKAVKSASRENPEANGQIGMALGDLLADILRKTGLRRAVISGGDSSGHAGQRLGIEALTFLAPTIPGAALFRAHANNNEFDGLELALKGGQMGAHDYFGQIRAGGGNPIVRRHST